MHCYLNHHLRKRLIVSNCGQRTYVVHPSAVCQQSAISYWVIFNLNDLRVYLFQCCSQQYSGCHVNQKETLNSKNMKQSENNLAQTVHRLFISCSNFNQFHTEGYRHVPISSEHFPNRINLTNQKASQQSIYLVILQHPLAGIICRCPVCFRPGVSAVKVKIVWMDKNR